MTKTLIFFISRYQPGVAETVEGLKKALETIDNDTELELEFEYKLEVIDIIEEPETAEKFNVLYTPTLIVSGHNGHRKIVGAFISKERLLRELI